MADPGWYKDRTDRSLARWFDGSVWTDHTLVIADQPEGIMPPPPDESVRPAAPEPEPEPEREREPEPEREPASWAPPVRQPDPTPDPVPPRAEPDPWAPPGGGATGSPIVVDASSAIDPDGAEIPEVPTLSLGGQAASTTAPEPHPPSIVPEPDPAPVVPEPEPDPGPVVPEPGPASHLEELPPQGTDLRTPTSASARSEPMPSFVGGRAFEPPSFEGPPPNRLAALPPWARVAVPVAALLVLVVAAVLVLGGDGGDNDPVSLDQATSIAEADLDVDVPAAKLESMIEQLCGAAETGTSVSAVILAKQLPVADRTELRSVIDATGTGAQRRCPDAAVDWDGLLDEVDDGAAVAFDP